MEFKLQSNNMELSGFLVES